MKVEVVLTPRDVRTDVVGGRAVAVFDVLRATTTMTAALAAGVREIHIFDSLDAAAQAARAFGDGRVLCGERACLPPPGFDLGNSPGAFQASLHQGRTVFMSTTNGTRAIVAARSAKMLLAAAVVNASAIAKRLAVSGLDVTLLCAGTGGEPAMEDVLGAGAVLVALAKLGAIEMENDLAGMATRLFLACRDDLKSAMTQTVGGRNVIAAGLADDIEFAARMDVLSVVGRVMDGPLRVIQEG